MQNTTNKTSKQEIKKLKGKIMPVVSQSALARKLGCSQAYISMVLSGERKGTPEMIKRMQEVVAEMENTK